MNDCTSKMDIIFCTSLVIYFTNRKKIFKCVKISSAQVLLDDLSDDEDMARQFISVYGKNNFFMRNFCLCSADVKSNLFTGFCYNVYCGNL